MYHRGEYYWVSSLLAAISLFSNIFVILLHKKHLSRKERTALEIYVWIMMFANIASLLFYGIFFTLLGSVAVAFLMLTVLVNEQVEFVKRSIRNKINYFVVVSMVTLTLGLVSFSIIIFSNASSKNAEIMMNESCQALALELNDQLKLVELAVNNLYDISEKDRPSIEELKDVDTATRYMVQMEKIAISVAENTDGAVAVYYRLNPELLNCGTSGFFSVKSQETGEFQHFEPTDLSAYDVDDLEHVAWYYIPVTEGRPVWTEPYYNANIDVRMVSYVIPVYEDGTLVGVIGMDIDFLKFEDILQNLDIYKSSGAVLCSVADDKIYSQKSDLPRETLGSDLTSLLQSDMQSKKILHVALNGDKYGVYFTTLENDMQLLTYAKVSEINSQLYSLIVIGFVLFTVIFILTLLMTLRLSNKIVGPITEIKEATKQYAEGNWDWEVSHDTEDEIGELANYVSIMAQKTREYIRQIEKLAKTDSLTGLRNKNGYLQYIEKHIVNDRETDGRLAVVVLDVNNLKIVNDSLGHEKGDELLQKTSKFICNMFSHSPIFRIGGDEFVVIVNGADYDMVEQKIMQFQNYMKSVSRRNNIMEVNVASGMAKLGIDGDTYEDIFKAADERMYQNKAELKRW